MPRRRTSVASNAPPKGSRQNRDSHLRCPKLNRQPYTMRQIRHETALRTGCVQREIKGTVVSATLESEDTYLVEIECDGIDIAAFEIIGVSLPYKRVASEATAGSRLMLICAADTEVVPGMRVEITVGFPDSQDHLVNAGWSRDDGQISDTPKMVGTFAGPADEVVRTREGHQVAQDTGDQGGGQN
jgi:hypothetical protein